MGGKNRIVIDYGDMEELILLSAIHTESGEEMEYDLLKEINENSFNFPITPKHDELKELSFDELKQLDIPNKEGFVIRFSSGFKMKIKFESYCRLHSIVTGVSNKTIWEYLKNNLSFEELLDNVPDEFYSYVEKTKNDLISEYQLVEIASLRIFKEIISNLLNENITITKKDFALQVKDLKYSSILFNMFNNKPYDYIIWNIIKPEYCRPFKNGIES